MPGAPARAASGRACRSTPRRARRACTGTVPALGIRCGGGWESWAAVALHESVSCCVIRRGPRDLPAYHALWSSKSRALSLTRDCLLPRATHSLGECTPDPVGGTGSGAEVGSKHHITALWTRPARVPWVRVALL